MQSCLAWAVASPAPLDGRPLLPREKSWSGHKQGFSGLLETIWPGQTEAQRGAGT